MHPLAGKVVLITGGSSGIGRGTALRLAEMGCRIVVASRNAEALAEVVREAEAKKAEALAVTTDVTDSEQCRRAVDATVARFGQLDILICSAGLSMRCYFEGTDLAAMERVVRVNFFGTLSCTHFALPHVKRQRGSLVAISSLTGRRGIPSYSVYGASKFAIQGLYDALRIELRRDGVHVGVVSPGFVDTPLRNQVLGPDGKPWAKPPEPPFRVWPVEKCVDKVVKMIVRRRATTVLPWHSRPLIAMDSLAFNIIGDWILGWKFPPEQRP